MEGSYNGAKPKVHSNGCNITMVDGHVEWIAFRELWHNTDGKPDHPYWHNK